jgi:hypothetical protein
MLAMKDEKVDDGWISCRQLQEMLHIKSAREQQLVMRVQALQSQLGGSTRMMGTSIYGTNNIDNPFSGIGDIGNEDLRSIDELDIRGLISGNSATAGRNMSSPLAAMNEDSTMSEQMLNDDLAALVDFRD